MECGGGVGAVLAVLVVDEEGGLDVGVVGVVVDELEGAVEAHDHEGCGHGVGVPRLGADDGDAEEAVVDGLAGGGVDGVGVADAVALVVFAVVAGGDYGLVAELDGGFDLLGAVFVLCRAFDAHGPGGAVGF